MKKLVALALVGLAAVACSTEDTEVGDPTFQPRTVAELDKTLVELQDQLGVRSIRAGIFVPGVGYWTKSVGFANADLAQPQTGAHHVRIGSITKTITVTMILELVDKGIMTLDDPIGKWVPEVPANPNATLRQLANMTSGIPSYTFNPDFQDRLFASPQAHWAPAELLAASAASQANGCQPRPDQCFAPGTAFFYSNTNTVLLGLALERATKKTYAENLRELVTEPLGMKETFQPFGGEMPKPVLRGYSLQGLPDGATTPREATTWDPSWGYAVGDIVSTFDDLRIWGKALGAGTLLTPATQAERQKAPSIPPNGPDRRYAVGVGYNYGWWGHGGELPGYNTVVYYRPDLDATIVVSVNQDQIPQDAGPPIHPAYVVADAIIAIANREAPLPGASLVGSIGE